MKYFIGVVYALLGLSLLYGDYSNGPVQEYLTSGNSEYPFKINPKYYLEKNDYVNYEILISDTLPELNSNINILVNVSSVSSEFDYTLSLKIRQQDRYAISYEAGDTLKMGHLVLNEIISMPVQFKILQKRTVNFLCLLELSNPNTPNEKANIYHGGHFPVEGEPNYRIQELLRIRSNIDYIENKYESKNISTQDAIDRINSNLSSDYIQQVDSVNTFANTLNDEIKCKVDSFYTNVMDSLNTLFSVDSVAVHKIPTTLSSGYSSPNLYLPSCSAPYCVEFYSFPNSHTDCAYIVPNYGETLEFQGPNGFSVVSVPGLSNIYYIQVGNVLPSINPANAYEIGVFSINPEYPNWPTWIATIFINVVSSVDLQGTINFKNETTNNIYNIDGLQVKVERSSDGAILGQTTLNYDGSWLIQNIHDPQVKIKLVMSNEHINIKNSSDNSTLEMDLWHLPSASGTLYSYQTLAGWVDYEDYVNSNGSINHLIMDHTFTPPTNYDNVPDQTVHWRPAVGWYNTGEAAGYDQVVDGDRHTQVAQNGIAGSYLNNAWMYLNDSYDMPVPAINLSTKSNLLLSYYSGSLSKITLATAGNNRDYLEKELIYHEYGHHYFNKYLNIPFPLSQGYLHHWNEPMANERDAFVEGFATFFGALIYPDNPCIHRRKYPTANIVSESYCSVEDLSLLEYYIDPNGISDADCEWHSGECEIPANQKYEARNAGVLWDFYDDNPDECSDDGTSVHFSFNEIVDLLLTEDEQGNKPSNTQELYDNIETTPEIYNMFKAHGVNVGKDVENENIDRTESWQGNYYIRGENTITNGTTITVEPGSKIYFYPDANLVCEGELIFQGSEQDSVFIQGFSDDNTPSGGLILKGEEPKLTVNYTRVSETKSGIQIVGSGVTLTINNSVFSNSNYGVHLTNAGKSVSINSCKFSNNEIGIYIAQSLPVIKNSYFEGNNAGIYSYYNSQPDIQLNNFVSNDVAVVFTHGSSGFLLADLNLCQKNNTFSRNTTGVWIYDKSHPNLGYTGKNQYGHNLFYQNDTDIVNENDDQSISIPAEWNYWGNYSDPCMNTFPVNLMGNIDFDPIANGDPNAPDFSLAENFEFAGDYNGAISEYSELLGDTDNNLSDIINILHSIHRCYINLDDEPEYWNFVSDKIFNSDNDKLIHLCMEYYAQYLKTNGDIQEAIYYFEQLDDTLATPEDEIVYIYETLLLNGMIDGGTLLKGTSHTLVTDLNQRIQLSQNNPISLLPEFKELSNYRLNESNVGLPKAYTLSSYPNPFNPTTTIKYDLPEPSKVKLTIYDITGRLISTLKNTKHTEGTYTAIWNGTDDSGNPVSTGVYFCRMRTAYYSKTIKMLYLK